MIPNKGKPVRFQTKRWGKTRFLINELEKGGQVLLPNAERNNALASVQRLAAAYSFKRKYRVLNRVQGETGHFRVMRVE